MRRAELSELLSVPHYILFAEDKTGALWTFRYSGEVIKVEALEDFDKLLQADMCILIKSVTQSSSLWTLPLKGTNDVKLVRSSLRLQRVMHDITDIPYSMFH